MPRWEYLILQDMHDIHSPGRLNALGAEGWDLVGFDSRNLPCFKRVLADALDSPRSVGAQPSHSQMFGGPKKPAKRSVKPKV